MGLIITISGAPGSGKSDVAKLLSKRFGIKHFSGGDLFREYAKERNLSIDEFWQQVEKDPTIWDTIIDPYQETLPDKYGSLILESRLGWHFVPGSVKIFLQVDPRAAAERIHNANRADEKGSVQDIMAEARRRVNRERAQYKKLYRIDHHDMKNYDLVIDTSDISQEQVVQKIVAYLEAHDLIDKKTI